MIEEVLNIAKEKMGKSINTLIQELKNVRSGRATPALVEDIVVEYYGNRISLKQIATITAPESRLIVIQPWDNNALSSIEKSILASDLGVTPTNDGKVIRLAFPQLSEEQRGHLVKVVHKKGEEIKIAIRNIRREAIHNINKKEKEDHISEDDVKRTKNKIQEITDEYIKKVDELITKKSEEIMEV